MKVMKKLWCRLYQFGFRCIMPLLPYREPKLLDSVLEVSKVLKEKNIDTILLVTDSGVRSNGLTEAIENDLSDNGIQVVVFDRTIPNPTIDNIEEAYIEYLNNKCHGIVAIGGGSVMDLAKAVGARVVRPKKKVQQMRGILKVGRKLPTLIAIPTTAGTGSETTLSAVVTDSNTKHKYAINDFNLIPHYAVLDESLTLGLPAMLTATTGMDALTHAIEAYIGNSTTKHTRECALDACKLIFENLTLAYKNGRNKTARKNMLKASYLAGVAFSRSYVGYVHAIAHSLGGRYNTPHGLANAVILPYVLTAYGNTIYKKAREIAVYSNIANEEDSAEIATKKLINKILEFNNIMKIPMKFDFIDPNDIPDLSRKADSEANPLYPVPLLMDAEELSKLYMEISK